MTRAGGGSTRLACILGWPARHSLSPAIHNAAFAAAGLDWVYVAFEVPPQSLAEAVAGLRALGVGGANVTMPHKQTVMPLLDEIAPTAERAGAVNTIVCDGGKLIGANTDGAGFVRFLERDAGIDPAGKRVLMLGAGGAARALAVSLGDAAAVLTVCARNPEAAADVARRAGTGATIAPWDERDSLAASSDLLINATPIGAKGEGAPVSDAALGPSLTVVDLIYAPPATGLVAAARAAGGEAHNGIGMLLHQAILAFELWTGAPAPEAVMSAALVSAMRGNPQGSAV